MIKILNYVLSAIIGGLIGFGLSVIWLRFNFPFAIYTVFSGCESFAFFVCALWISVILTVIGAIIGILVFYLKSKKSNNSI